MLKRIVDKVSSAVTRRGFISSFTSACSVIVLGAFGLEQVAMAKAYPEKCCTLCSLTRCTNIATQCAGTWCWTCSFTQGNSCTTYQCLECYNSNSPRNCFGACDQYPMCQRPCDNIVCSQFTPAGKCL